MSKKKQILELIDKNSLVYTDVSKLFLFLSSALDMDLEETKKLFYSLVNNGDLYEIRKNKFIAIPSHGYVKGEFLAQQKGLVL